MSMYSLRKLVTSKEIVQVQTVMDGIMQEAKNCFPDLIEVTLAGWLYVFASTFVAFTVAQIIYNVHFHPCAKFPGPSLAGSTLLWRFWHSMGGRFHRVIEQQHKKYGPVFRVSPNELSFASAPSWKAIYGLPSAGKPQLIKSEFYDMYGSGFKTGCIGSERDPKLHSQKKRNLTAAFSTRALLEQEAIIQGCIDQFITKIGRLGKSDKGINMSEWYENVAFDILGEMAFGESFRCVEKEQHHFWMDLILKHLHAVTLVDNLRRYTLLATLGRRLLPKLTTSVRDKHTNYSRAKVQKRLESTEARTDFLTNLVAKVKSGQVPKEEMTAHSSTLIIAGGETVSTFLAAATYHLLQTPRTYAKLKNEIRSRYSHYEQIDASSALQLPYLQAVIHEGLRIYPPGSLGFPRISPGTDIDGYWVPKGVEVYTSAWTVTHDPKYFENPNEFKPERWINLNSMDVKEASQPFSLGLRACIGQNFAMLEISSILAKLVYTYNMELVSKDLDWEGASSCFVMWWKPELFVRYLPAN